MNIKTSRLTITTFSPGMAQRVYENSQDDDTRRFVPDEVYDSVEEAREAIDFLISRYDSNDGPFVYPIITNDGGKTSAMFSFARLMMVSGKSAITLQKTLPARATPQKQ